MATSSRLYPPNIAGTLPSFYKDITTGTATLVVPFSMNTAVAASAVRGFYMKIKTTTTDTLLLQTSSTLWDRDENTVTFVLDEDVLDKMIIGDFYKIQIAYYSYTDIVGYYSTSSIVKYTYKPTVSILGLTVGSPTATAAYSFVGKYENKYDVNEKVYSYRWKLKGTVISDAGIVIKDVNLDTDWLIHDTTTDEENSSSTDTLVLNELLSTGTEYTILYMITTNNGMVLSSPVYHILASTNIIQKAYCRIHASLDYENARIRLSFSSKYESTRKFSGTYLLIRADSRSNYLIWNTLGTFTLDCNFEDWIYYDYTIESGVAYLYGIELITNNSRSMRLTLSLPIPSYFEYAYLYDGTRQLKIAYNVNISSFKEVVAETKKTTLGSKYPYILRSGILKYKEFPIQGLVSYLMDSDVLFVPRTLLLDTSLMAAESLIEKGKVTETTDGNLSDSAFLAQELLDYENSTDQTDRNVTKEKNFALFALEWLNNGEIKLFKSPQEGNYIVKLTNVSLSPFNGTDRMVHTFSCTADEVQEFNTTALIKYNLLQSNTVSADSQIWADATTIVDLNRIRDTIDATYMSQPNAGQLATEAIRKLNLFSGLQQITAFRIVEAPPNLLFEYNSFVFNIPKNGTYYIENNNPLDSALITTNATNQFFRGRIEVFYKVLVNDQAVYSDSTTVRPYLGFSCYGNEIPNYEEQILFDENGDPLPPIVVHDGTSGNILKEFTLLKKLILTIYYRNIHTLPLRANSLMFLTDASIDSTLFGSLTDPEYYKKAIENYAGKYQDYLTLRNTNVGSDNNYYVWGFNNSDDYEFVESFKSHMAVKNWDATILIGLPSNPKIDIRDYASGEISLNIDVSDLDLVNYVLGQGSFVNFYFLVQENHYAVEEVNSDLINARRGLETAREVYLAKLFHFTSVTNINGLKDVQFIYTYDNERFIPHSANDWKELKNTNTIYIVDPVTVELNPSNPNDSSVISLADYREEILNKYKDWFNLYTSYNTALSRALGINNTPTVPSSTQELEKEVPSGTFGPTSYVNTTNNISTGSGTYASADRTQSSYVIASKQALEKDAKTYPGDKELYSLAGVVSNSTLSQLQIESRTENILNTVETAQQLRALAGMRAAKAEHDIYNVAPINSNGEHYSVESGD